MNIFEALAAGNGKVTLPGGNEFDYHAIYNNGRFLWDSKTFGRNDIELHTLKRNDWIPYVPTEKRKSECANCGRYNYPGLAIYVSSEGNCSCCGRKLFSTNVPRGTLKEKVTHGEEFS